MIPMLEHLGWVPQKCSKGFQRLYALQGPSVSTSYIHPNPSWMTVVLITYCLNLSLRLFRQTDMRIHEYQSLDITALRLKDRLLRNN